MDETLNQVPAADAEEEGLPEFLKRDPAEAGKEVQAPAEETNGDEEDDTEGSTDSGDDN